MLEEEFPEVNAEYFGYGVSTIKKLGFTLAHSQFYRTTMKEKKLELIAIAIKKDGTIFARIDKHHTRVDSSDK